MSKYATPEEYAEHVQKRYERLLARANKAQTEGDARLEKAHNMASIIPFGQPILVGHYSENRDRNYREKIHRNFGKGFELHQQASALRERAASVANNDAISSDDPEALQKISARIEQLEALQARMKLANKLVKKNDREGLLASGFTESQITVLFTPNVYGTCGYEKFELTNNNANIKRLKNRKILLERETTQQTTERTLTTPKGDVRIVDNVEDRRLQIFFPCRVSRDVFMMLKQSGFRVSPSVGEFCFQAYRSYHANYQATRIVETFSLSG